MITKFLNTWANSGDTGTTPTTTKQDSGFVRREPPTRQLFNWLFNGLQNRINDIADRLNQAQEDLPDFESVISSGYHPYTWSSCIDGINQINIGSGAGISRIHTFFINGVPHLLMMDISDDTIKIYNARTRLLIDTSPDLTTSITGTSVQVWDFCTDNEFIYVLFAHSTGFKVGRFVVGDTWDYDPSWTAGGTALYGGPTSGDARIRVVYDNYIAVSNPGVLVTSSSSAAIQILNKSNGSIYNYGAGDCPTSLSLSAMGNCASYGPFVFFHASVGYGSATNYLCSINVDSPTSGCGGSGYPASIAYPLKVVAAGANIISIHDEDDPTDSTKIFYNSHAGTAFLNGVNAGTALNGAAAKYTMFGGCQDAVFDGQNVWIGVALEVGSGPTYRNAVVGFDVFSMSNYGNSSNATLDFSQIIKGPYYLPDAPSYLTLGKGPRLCFDGRDLWTCSLDQYVNRIPRIALR